MKTHRITCWLLLIGWSVTGYVHAQIRGGAETATFEAGDLTLYQEDLSGTPIGAQVEGWEILRGNYEVAEFQDRRWFRPLTSNTHILRCLQFPEEFSVEFTAYFFEAGNAELRVFLHTAEEIERGPGPEGPAQIYLTAGRVDQFDGIRLQKWVRPVGIIYQDVVARGYGAYGGRGGFLPGRPHHIALQVRGGELALYVDGERIAVTPFQPKAPLEAISFRFLARSGHDLPYKDRPALLGELRIAAYSGHALQPTGGIRLFWALPGEPERLSQLDRSESQIVNNYKVLNVLKQHYGWQEAVLVAIEHPNPFAAGGLRVQMREAEAQKLVAYLKEQLAVVHSHNGGLLIIGEGGDGRTERERKLLANIRTLAFVAWLAEQGMGDFSSVVSFIADNSGYESVLFRRIGDVGKYEGLY